MRSVNRVTLLGHVGQDPIIRGTAKGGVVANLMLATNDTRENETLTEWHRLVAFGRSAEIVRDYVVKGSPLYVEGQLHTREWEQDGLKRYTTQVVIRDLSLPGNKAANKSKSTALNGGTSDAPMNEWAGFDSCPEEEL